MKKLEKVNQIKVKLYDCEDEFGTYHIMHPDEELDIGHEVETILDKYKTLNEEYNLDEFLDLLRMFGFEVSENLSDADLELYF